MTQRLHGIETTAPPGWEQDGNQSDAAEQHANHEVNPRLMRGQRNDSANDKHHHKAQQHPCRQPTRNLAQRGFQNRRHHAFPPRTQCQTDSDFARSLVHGKSDQPVDPQRREK